MNAKRHGFTLTELLVVVAMMAVIAAIAIPSITGLSRGAGIDAAMADLRSTFSLARQWAITQRMDTFVVFRASDARGYNVYTSEGYVSQWKELPVGYAFLTNRFTQVTDSADGHLAIVFRPSGASSGANLKKVFVGEAIEQLGVISERPNGIKQSLEIYPLTGGMRILEHSM